MTKDSFLAIHTLQMISLLPPHRSFLQVEQSWGWGVSWDHQPLLSLQLFSPF